ncbi:aminodeoxychorismate synthase component I [Aurantivibrio infirmus]
MAALKLIEIPFYKNGQHYFNLIKHLPYPVWLDSGRPKAEFGRFDIITARPSKLFVSSNNSTEVTDFEFTQPGKDDRALDPYPENTAPLIGAKTKQQVFDSNSDSPFNILRESMDSITVIDNQDIPFTGGLIGYFAYTLSNYLDFLPAREASIESIPDMHVGLYLWSFIQDHEQKRSFLAIHPDCPEILELEAKFFAEQTSSVIESHDNTFNINELKSNFDVNSYNSAFMKIQDYLAAGDCYQVNFAQRFEAKYQGDPSDAYLRLRKVLPAPYSSFLGLKDGAILSHSPEQFLKVQNQHVRTQPIKGTSRRHNNPALDKESASKLQASAKDRSENLMIVDLMRNDLGKNCRSGSVTAKSLFELKSYANVHHLVSTIEGELKASSSAIELFRDCFPGGSVTGAPKTRAMAIIQELETVDRSVYCGSIAYISANNQMDSSITIRTLVCDRETIYCWGGGGIVADSTASAEYQESLDKIQILLDTLRKEK